MYAQALLNENKQADKFNNFSHVKTVWNNEMTLAGRHGGTRSEYAARFSTRTTWGWVGTSTKP